MLPLSARVGMGAAEVAAREGGPVVTEAISDGSKSGPKGGSCSCSKAGRGVGGLPAGGGGGGFAGEEERGAEVEAGRG